MSSVSSDEIPNLFTEEQKLALVVASYFPSFLSIVGSTCVVFVLLCDKEEKKPSPFRRLMLGLMVMDLIAVSNFLFMSWWAVPPAPWTSRLAMGNIATCNATGFFFTISIGAMPYTAFLTALHCFIVRYEMKPRKFAIWVEPWMHFISVAFPCAVAIYAIHAGYMNSLNLYPGTCYVGDNPPDCVRRDDIVCRRGHSRGDWYLSVAMFGGSVLSSFILIFIFMILLYKGVRNTEKKLQRYGHGSTRSNLILSRRVGIQGLLYVGTFFAAYGFSMIVSLALVPNFPSDASNRNIYFPFVLLSSLTTPLQGFLNAIVFFHGRWKKLTAPDRAMYTFDKILHLDFSSLSFDRNQAAERAAQEGWPSAAVFRSIGDNDETPEFLGLGRSDKDKESSVLVDSTDIIGVDWNEDRAQEFTLPSSSRPTEDLFDVHELGEASISSHSTNGSDRDLRDEPIAVSTSEAGVSVSVDSTANTEVDLGEYRHAVTVPGQERSSAPLLDGSQSGEGEGTMDHAGCNSLDCRTANFEQKAPDNEPPKTTFLGNYSEEEIVFESGVVDSSSSFSVSSAPLFHGYLDGSQSGAGEGTKDHSGCNSLERRTANFGQEVSDNEPPRTPFLENHPEEEIIFASGFEDLSSSCSLTSEAQTAAAHAGDSHQNICLEALPSLHRPTKNPVITDQLGFAPAPAPDEQDSDLRDEPV